MGILSTEMLCALISGVGLASGMFTQAVSSSKLLTFILAETMEDDDATMEGKLQESGRLQLASLTMLLK